MNRPIVMLAAALLMAAPCATALASTYSLSAFLHRYHSNGEIESYEALLSLSPGISGFGKWDEVEVKFISPSGVRYEQRFPRAPLFVSLKDILPDALDEAVSGAWRIEEIRESGPTRLYEFTIPPLENSILFPPAPQILAPQDGAIVGPVFEVITDLTDGFGASYKGNVNPRDALPSTEVTGPGKAVFSFADVPGFSGGTLQLRASDNNILDTLEPRALTSGPFVTFNDKLILTSYSAPVSLTIVVPEPSALSVSAVGFAVLTALSRRRRSQPLI